MTYEEELNYAIKISFGYHHNELYDNLKDNIIPIDILGIMIIGISKMVDRINQDKETFHTAHLKDVSIAIQFINQMRFIYTEEKLNTVKLIDKNGNINSIKIADGSVDGYNLMKKYRRRINKIVHLTPFDFILSIIGNAIKYQYHFKLLFNISRICDSCLVNTDCFSCSKYRFHTKCDCNSYTEVGAD